MASSNTTSLIVLAHPDPRSFNGAWANASHAACKALGHEVLWSDLVSMGFDAVERGALYPDRDPDVVFDPLKAQEQACDDNRLPRDVVDEIEKVRNADNVIFHFPMWWFAPPAVLKGWFDRVLAHGALHTVDQRFDTGLCRGRNAQFCVTTGADEIESAHNGKEGDPGYLLWPAAYTLRYLGFNVLEPEVVHGVHGYHKGQAKEDLEQRLKSVLSNQIDLIGMLGERRAMQFNSDTDFDQDGRLKPEAPELSPFIRHQR